MCNDMCNAMERSMPNLMCCDMLTCKYPDMSDDIYTDMSNDMYNNMSQRKVKLHSRQYVS